MKHDYSTYKVVKDSKSFSLDKLINPDFYLWPGYIWILNDKIDRKKIDEQLKDMYEHNAKSVVIFALPKELGREATCYSMLDMTYLSKEYLDLIKYIADICEELGMHLWFYDEGGWPSIIGAGQVFARNPVAFAKKEVTYNEFTLGKDEKHFDVPEGVLFAGVPRIGKWQIYKPGERIDFKEDESIVRMYYIKIKYDDAYNSCKYDAPFANNFKREATETFIKITHERFKSNIGDKFGKNVFFTFMDEPAVSQVTSKTIPWGDDFNANFELKYGYSLLNHIPYLLSEEEADDNLEIQKVRVDLFDYLSRLFVENFLNLIQDWCHRNNLLSSGHLWEECNLDRYRSGGVFHMLREYRAMDVPGVDYIFRQIFPSQRSPVYLKYATSISRQKGMPYTVTESFAVAGNGITPAQMRWCIGQQFVRGANLTQFGCYPYSTWEHLMPGERPHFDRVNPLQKYMDMFNEYTARLAYITSRGEAVCNVAVYLDMRSIWAGVTSRQKALRLHEDISRILLEHQIDFDFIDDDVLAEREGIIKDGKLVVGMMTYDSIVVPETDWMEKGAVEGLNKFAESGGKLLVVGKTIRSESLEGLALSIVSTNIITTNCENLPNYLEPVVRLQPWDDGIRVAKRVADGVKIYYLFNEYTRKAKTKAIFPEKEQPVLCDIENGKFMEIDAQKEGDKTLIKIDFEPWESNIILFGVEDAVKKPKSLIGKHKIPLDIGWKLRAVKRYSVGRFDFEITEIKEDYQEVELRDWSKYLGDYFSGDVEYMVEFDCPEALTGRKAMLELGVLCYACEAEVNGCKVGRRMWAPYSFRIDAMLKMGKNQIKIIVTNTLANAIYDPEAIAIWRSRTTDEVLNKPKGFIWDDAARDYEKDSLSGGLFGPVKILFE